MANEATKTFLYGPNAAGESVNFTCSASTNIPKGTLLVLSNPRTVAPHASAGQIFAGVAATEKDENDTSTTIAVWTNGVFKMASSGTINAGDQVILSNASSLNYVEASNVIVNTRGIVVGIAEDNASSCLVSVRVLK